MILLTKLDGTPFVLNSDLIETIEHTPDTKIRLFNQRYMMVQESMEEVVQKVIEFRREFLQQTGKGICRWEHEG